MTPEEKGQEIFDKYDNYPLTFEWKKQCALIAVDEIINCDSFFENLGHLKHFKIYWYRVQSYIKSIKQ